MPARFVARATIWNGEQVYHSGDEVPPEEFDGRTFSMLRSSGQVIEEYEDTAPAPQVPEEGTSHQASAKKGARARPAAAP